MEIPYFSFGTSCSIESKTSFCALASFGSRTGAPRELFHLVAAENFCDSTS